MHSIDDSVITSLMAVTHQVNIVSAGSGRAVAEMRIEQEHTNRTGILHGGFVAALVDSITTIAMMSDDTAGAIIPGVSVDLSVHFLSKGAAGNTVVMQAETLKRGRTLAYLTMDLIDKESRRLIARGTHTKFIAPPCNKL